MNVLAVDTCFGAVSVALRWRSARGETLLREDYEERDSGHAERLMPMLDTLMHNAGVTFAEIDRIAVTIGPGSFTGLRIGVATARALSLALNKPTVAMTSLAVMAARADSLIGEKRDGRPIVVAVDARRGALYCEVFGENAGDSLTGARVVPAAEAAQLSCAQAVIAVGSGAEAFAHGARDSASIEVMLPSLQPHARYLAILAPVLQPRANLEPLYLREADAKAHDAHALVRRPS
jgi:tRNA threonylcarbamoyladenosine biosynthesis protein TsaB